MGVFVNIRASNGQFFCAEGGGGREVVANRPVASTWETFELDGGTGPGGEPKPGDTVTLRSQDGRYVQSDLAHGSRLQAAAPVAQTWEKFKVEEVQQGAGVHFDGPIALKNSEGHYVCAEGGGGREVIANRPARGP